MEEMPREDSVRASNILYWNENEVNFQKMVQLAIFMRISHYYTIWEVEFNRA
jgi:predicted Zn-dependent protease with MMP-like domain